MASASVDDPWVVDPLDPAGISVVIVNWNGGDQLVECLQSLQDQTDRAFETVVVDNGSTDGSVAMVRERFADVRLVETGANVGFAEGCNRGIAASVGAWVATLNNDAAADRRWIAELRRALRAGGERLGMVQSRILFKQRPERLNSTGLQLNADGTFVDRDFDVPVDEARGGAEVFCATAGAALYRRAMLEQTALETGVFDRSFFMYCEDVDLGWRCRLAGWEARYAPQATVWHAFQHSSRQRDRRFVRTHCDVNRVRTLAKNGSVWFAVRYLPRLAEDLTWALRYGEPGILGRYRRALVEGLRQRREVGRMVEVPRRAIERRFTEPPRWLARLSRRARLR